VVDAIRSWGYDVFDLGTHSTEPCDYPDIAASVATSVSSGETDRGILICGSGIGVSIAANKISGIRAALCHDSLTAKLSRNHNDANVLCLPGDSLGDQQLADIVKLWLAEPFEGGRHARRVEKIHQLERLPVPQ
jgi:ribose 5-phosphate isomerase B